MDGKRGISQTAVNSHFACNIPHRQQRGAGSTVATGRRSQSSLTCGLRYISAGCFRIDGCFRGRFDGIAGTWSFIGVVFFGRADAFGRVWTMGRSVRVGQRMRGLVADAACVYRCPIHPHHQVIVRRVPEHGSDSRRARESLQGALTVSERSLRPPVPACPL